MNVATVQNYLNEVFKQSIVEWEVDKKNPETFHFDTDFDGAMNKSEGHLNWWGNVRDLGFGGRKAILLFDYRPKGVAYVGWAPGGEYTYTYNQSTLVIAHELAHATWSLDHPDENGDPDEHNLMHSAGTAAKLRKAQWDLIHK